MFEYYARQLAYAVLFQAVKDYIADSRHRARILRELRQMGRIGKTVADKLEFHLDEVIENLGKGHLFEEVM